MRPIFGNNLSSLLAAATIALAAASCSTPKNITYMEQFGNSEKHITSTPHALTAQPDDKLAIIVNTDNPTLSEMLNLAAHASYLGQSNYGSTTRTVVSQSQTMTFYTVDPRGDINFPLLGKLHIQGMTRSQIEEYITRRLEEADLAKKPIVIVEFGSAGVTLAGEVLRPGRYQLTRDHVTILDVLGEAGDLTIQGKRDNILVVRTEGGVTTSYRIDLTDGDALMQSPVYYMQQNDYIYVEPNNMKKRSSTVNGNNVLSASFWVSIASLLTSIAVLVFK